MERSEIALGNAVLGADGSKHLICIRRYPSRALKKIREGAIVGVWGKGIPGGRNSLGKGPGAAPCLAY